MAVPTRPVGFQGLPEPGQVGDFDLEQCFKQFQNACLQAESPIYWTASYAFVSLLFVALILNLLAISLFIRGFNKFKKVSFVFYPVKGVFRCYSTGSLFSY